MTPQAAKALISYSHKDEKYRVSLVIALATAVRNNEIELWSDHQILPGQHIDEEILAQLKEADVIFLIISQDFIASDYCFKKELEIALERHRNERAVVIPIVARPTDLSGVPFESLQRLPYDGKAISTWENQDEAWLDVSRSVRKLIKKIMSEREKHSVVSSNNMRSQLAQCFDLLQSRYENPTALPGVAFGCHELDEACDGIWDGELALIASRPSHGNVELAAAMAINVALSEKKKVLVLSQRHAAQQYTNRLLCAVGRISRMRLSRGNLEDEDWSRVAGAIRLLLNEGDITIDDDSIRSISDLKQKLEGASKKGFKLILIDGVEYLASGAKDQEKTLVMMAKDFAKKYECAVVLTLMLGAHVDERYAKRPLMADLREWRPLENVADKIFFCYREDVYTQVKSVSDIEINIAKSQDGFLGSLKLRMIDDYGLVYDPADAPNLPQ